MNAAERKSIRAAEKAAKEAEQQRINFVVAAMSTVQGRRWFHDLLAACHIFADPFSGDALLEAYSKGERNVGLRIYLDVVTHCPESFILMMKEANIQEILNDRRTAAGEQPRSPDGDGGAEGRDDASDDGDEPVWI